MTDPTSRDLDALTAEPDDLDGHTIEQLADYLDAGRTPPDPSIEGSPACRRAIAALERLRVVSADFLTDDTRPDSDDAWVDSIMQRLGSEARAGADVLLDTTPDGHQVLTTEGVLRSLVRAAGDEEPGVLVGRIRISGDLTDPAAEVVVALDLAITFGVVVADSTDRVRASVITRLQQHTLAQRIRVDITVRDLITGEQLP